MTGLLGHRPLTGDRMGPAELREWLGDDAGVRANMVASADGHATVGGRVGALTGPADQLLLNALRAWCDVLLVGAGTVRAEGYGVIELSDDLAEARVRRGQASRPVLAILSASADLDPDLPAFAEAGPGSRPWLITLPGADTARLAPYVRILEVPAGEDGRPSVPAAVHALRSAGLGRVLSEGGPTALGELLRWGLVDELFLTLAPLVIGGEGLGIVRAAEYQPPLDLRLLSVLGAGSEVFLRYQVAHGPAAERR